MPEVSVNARISKLILPDFRMDSHIYNVHVYLYNMILHTMYEQQIYACQNLR